MSRLSTVDITRVELPGEPQYGDKLAIAKMLSVDTTGNDYSCHSILSAIDDCIEWSPVNARGKFAKRIRKHFKAIGMPLPGDDVLSKVSSILQESKLESEFRTVDITRDFSWSDGLYGHGDSCWWGTGKNGYSRDSLYAAGGFAMRFYRSSPRYSSGYTERDGIGRIWILPYKDRFYLFNAYGDDVELSIGAKILVALFPNLANLTISRWSSVLCDAMYINSNRALIMHAESDKPDSGYNYIEIPTVEYGELYNSSESLYTCENCGQACDEDEVYNVNGDNYCESCYSENFARCTHCDDDVPIDDAECSPDGDYYCEYCFNRFYSTCNECGNSVSNEDVYELDGDSYCESCYCDYSFTCESCDDVNHVTNKVILDGREYCDSCTTNCPRCGQTVLNDDFNRVIGVCNECQNSIKPIKVFHTSYAINHQERELYATIEWDAPTSGIACPNCGTVYKSALYREAYAHIAECDYISTVVIPENQLSLGI